MNYFQQPTTTTGVAVNDEITPTKYVAYVIPTHIDSKHKCIGVFLDLAKVFDTISFPILIKKMEEIGIRGRVLDHFLTGLLV